MKFSAVLPMGGSVSNGSIFGTGWLYWSAWQWLSHINNQQFFKRTAQSSPPIVIRQCRARYVKYATLHGASFGWLRSSITLKLSKRWRKNIALDQKWLYFQSHLLSFEDVKHWRPPEVAPWKAAYFTYQALNFLINIGGLNWGNQLAKTGTEPPGSWVS